ncbi:MAG: MarR family transcriptional regulator [Syntrophales bacterium]|jgi:DNA-binding MarR family transcriptional regulator|nr:MarR family transcriptional regulator [Syntrophales bacterium]MDY0044648.1 MarR family transcriptional regulator [Syntrophales bacterium]
MTDNIFPDATCFIFLLAKAYQRGNNLVQKRLLPYGVTNNQYVILETLWKDEGLTAHELEKRLAIDKATLSGILDRMVESKLLIKRMDLQDRRMLRLFPTGKALSLKKRLVEERQKANEELLSGFTREERILLKRLLMNMAQVS